MHNSSESTLSRPASELALSTPYGSVIAILALSIGGLFLGSGEFASMSLLPAMADSTGVSIPVAGSYISAYALGVVLGSPVIAALGAKWSRKTLLLALMAIFFSGYIASAFAWSYSSLIATRFLAGLPHGAYYGVAALVAATMVPANRQTQAIGYVMMGLAAANVIGVPVITWIGQHAGWRFAFSVIAAGGIITAIMIYFFIPNIAVQSNVNARSELSVLKLPQVWLTLGVATFGFGGMFAVYSYITPTLTAVTHLRIEHVPLALATWGLGMVVGNLLGGWLADRALIPTIFGMLVWNVVFLTLFTITASSPIWALLTLFLIGNGFALVPALQSHLMQISGNAQTLAAALNHSAFNTSNAIGATLGGLAIANNLGWSSTGWVGGLLGISGVGFMYFERLYATNAKLTLEK